MASLRYVLLGLAAVLSGCVGNQTQYKPGHEPVPRSETVQDEYERELARVVPMETARYDWYLLQGRQEVRRIRGNVSRNPWRSYERDMATTLGEYAGEYLRRDPSKIMSVPEPDEDEDEAEGDDWGGDDGGGDDGGDDWGDDEGGDDDW